MIDLLTIELKMIDSIIFDSMTDSSMPIDSMTVELIALIERLIEMLIESLIAVKEFAVERFVIELIEKYLIKLIRMHVDTSEIDLITIEMLIDVQIKNYFFSIAMFFRLKNHF